MSTGPSPITRLLKNKCSRIESQSKSFLLTRIITNFCQDYIRDASRRPTKKIKSKGESIVEYSWAGFLET